MQWRDICGRRRHKSFQGSEFYRPTTIRWQDFRLSSSISVLRLCRVTGQLRDPVVLLAHGIDAECSEAEFQNLSHGGCPCRHPMLEAEIVNRGQLFR
jgi:hypothetical protein